MGYEVVFYKFLNCLLKLFIIHIVDTDLTLSNEAMCSNQSVGPVNELFQLLIRTSLAYQCSISPPSIWPPDYGPTAVEQGLTEYDYIIIGAGSAGSVLADRLTEDPHLRVLLLEAGGDPPAESEIPAFAFNLKSTEYDWKFRGESKNTCLAYSDGCYMPACKMLGGSHGHNGMIYVRGNDRDYNNWEEHGNPTWNWKTVLEYFKKSEGNRNRKFVSYKNGEYHNAHGKLIVDSFGSSADSDEIIFAAGEEIGYGKIEDINAGKWLGFSYSQGTLSDGRRQSVAKTFLTPASKRPNLHIIKHAFATRLQIEDKEAVGVEFTYNKIHKMIAKNRRGVILSAGVFSSPKILMLSGIGPRDHLEKLNISVIRDLCVGDNLQDHPTVPMFFRFRASNASEFSQRETLDDLFQFILNNRGPLATAPCLTGYLNTANDDSIYPDILVPIFHFRRGYPDLKDFLNNHNFLNTTRTVLLKHIDEFDVVCFDVGFLNPSSRGEVRLNSRSPFDEPNINPNYFNHDNDMAMMERAITQIVALTETKAFHKNDGHLIPLPVVGCDYKNTAEYYRCYIRYFCHTGYHPVGTSKMGPDTDSKAVVDPYLRVKGIKKLWQIDAGVMPFVPSGNTNAPTIMIAERGADFIKWSHKQNN